MSKERREAAMQMQNRLDLLDVLVSMDAGRACVAPIDKTRDRKPSL